MIQFGCPCGRNLSVSDERKGGEKKCPDCGRVLIVPQSGGGLAQEAGAAGDAAPELVAPKSASGTDLPTKTCPKCGARIAVSALACRHCGAFLDAMSDAVSDKVKSMTPTQGLPCERPDVPFWTGMLQTLKLVWLEPRNAFSSLAGEPNLGKAVVFAALFGGLGLALYAVWSFLFQGMIQDVVPPQLAGAIEAPTSLAVTIFVAMISPIVVVLASLLGGCLYHLGLVLTGATRRELSTSLAVALYVTGATYAAYAIPCCGIFLALWMLVLAPMALIYAHGCETWKGIAAVYWPVVLCCIPLGIIFLVFMARANVGV